MFKICPRCGDEFVPHVESCPDCRVPLQASDGTPPPPRSERVDAPLQRERAVSLRHGAPADLREIADALSAAGLACAIDADPPHGLGVFVDERDVAAGQRVLAQWMETAIPGAEQVAGGSIDACPGCGEPLPEHPTACASCGLEFPPLELPCPRCGQPVAAEAESCAACGHRP